VPALRASAIDVNESLKEGGRGSPGGMRRQRFRSALVVSEVALALMLLIGGGLLIRSFYQLQRIDSGFSVQRLLTFQLALPTTRYPSDQRTAAFYDAVIERI